MVSRPAVTESGPDGHAPINQRSRKGAIDVWRVELGHETDAHPTGVPPCDARRDRRRTLSERSYDALQRVLARYLGCPPGDVALKREAGGKPYLANPRHRSLRFNMSRSGERCLIAIGEGAVVGVDLERVRPIGDFDQMASRVFAAPEAAAIQSTHGQGKARAFFGCWTRKESYAKATGLGLALEFDRFIVSVADEHEPRIIALIDDDPTRWSLRSFDPWPGFVAAVATDQRLRRD